MNAVINPNMLFITDDDWNNEELRDQFLENITRLIKYIETNDNILLYWDDDFEYLLWEYPLKKPWAHDTDWSNQLVSILFNFFTKKSNICNIDEACLYDESEPTPASDQYPEILRMMHYCIGNSENVFFITDRNTPDNETFCCKCHQFRENPKIVRKLTDFYDADSLIYDYWPQDCSEKEKLCNLIKYTAELDKEIYRDKDIRNEFEFSDGFMEEIINKNPSRKKKMVSQIVKRLQMTEEQAKTDGTLQDEYINTVKERRMRITGEPTSIRVHYKYGPNRKLNFLHYYREGEHDVGL